MYYVFQLGDIVTRLRSSSIKDRSLSYDQKWRNQFAQATYAPGGVSQLGVRPLPDKTSWKLEGTILCHDECETADELFNYLLAVAGRVGLPMIVASSPQLNSCCGQRSEPRCPYCNTIKYTKWMYAPVVITEVKRKMEEKTGKAFYPFIVPVELTLQLASYLEPLDQIQWRYWYDHHLKYTFHSTVLGTVTEQQYHPVRVDWPSKRNDRDHGFEKLRFSGYSLSPFTDPSNWVRGYRNDRPEEHEKAHLLTDDPASAIGVLRDHAFITPIHRWPAPPRSMYYFSNFDLTEVGGSLTGQIKIQVESDMPSMMSDSTESILNLSDIDDALVALGYGGLLADDELIVGHVGYPGGMLLRSGERIDMFIPWSYEGLYPGETHAGWNQVSVEESDADSFAVCHVYRTI